MKKIIFILVIVGALYGFYEFFVTKQDRLGDDYTPEGFTQNEEVSVIEENKDSELIDFKVYYYSKDDRNCSEPLQGHVFDDIDKRYKYAEITALVALLTRPAPEEYSSPIIIPTTLNQLSIRQGVAYADVSSFISLGDGSCSYIARKKQIDATLLQFEDVNEVVILADGVEVE